MLQQECDAEFRHSWVLSMRCKFLLTWGSWSWKCGGYHICGRMLRPWDLWGILSVGLQKFIILDAYSKKKHFKITTDDMFHFWADRSDINPFCTITVARARCRVSNTFICGYFSAYESQKLIWVGWVEDPKPISLVNMASSNEHLDNRNLIGI